MVAGRVGPYRVRFVLIRVSLLYQRMRRYARRRMSTAPLWQRRVDIGVLGASNKLAVGEPSDANGWPEC